VHAGRQRLRLGLSPEPASSPACTGFTKARRRRKLEALRNFLKEFGIGLGGGDDPTAQ
jgi:hypothetical protein